MLRKLFVKTADGLLGFLRLCRLQLVDVSDETVFLFLVFSLEWVALCYNRFKIAVEEVEAWDIIPWLQDVSGEDDDLVRYQHLLQCLLSMFVSALVALILPHLG